MAWSFSSEFEHAARIERKFSRYGFFAFLAAAFWTADPAEKVKLLRWWPDIPERLEQEWTKRQVADIVEFARYARPITFVICAALHADLENQRYIDHIYPGINEEISIRYNTPLSLMPGEEQKYDGRMWRCLDEKLSEFRYRVVEVSA